MSEPKPCPFCGGESTHLSSCHFSKIALVRQYDREFPYTKIKRPTESELDEAWNNRPYENKIKADAVERALEELLVECNSFWSDDTGDTVVCYDNIKEVMGIIIDKLYRGGL